MFEFQFQTRESGRAGEGFYYLLIATSRDGLNALESLYLLLQKASSPRQSVGQSGRGLTTGAAALLRPCAMNGCGSTLRPFIAIAVPVANGRSKDLERFFFLIASRS
jgi:hypothetical protein|uniref:Uncharacterized protein n=1 Tax=Zea mays TaxID=4577 RepID=C4J2C0_MAIZE|nr:unknown [Zea mays]